VCAVPTRSNSRPRTLRQLAAATIALAAIGAACGDDDEAADDSDGTAIAVEAGSSVEAASGASLELTLESNPTTGYRWEVREMSDPTVVELVGDEYIGPDTTLVGAGGVQVLTFRALDPGTSQVDLWYIRSFDDPPAPADEVAFTVTVTD
jgi:inhibitor of cysteine peptidase